MKDFNQLSKKSRETLKKVMQKPASGTIKWRHIESMLIEMGALISEREGSRVGVKLFGKDRVFHRPHPSPDTDKGAVAALAKWLGPYLKEVQ